MVDLYHAMYIKSLQCLFDKYKTRFGLKESDLLYIQWKDEGALLKLWTLAASSDPSAPFPTPSMYNLGAWFGSSLDCKLYTWARLLKRPLLSALCHTHTHTYTQAYFLFGKWQVWKRVTSPCCCLQVKQFQLDKVTPNPTSKSVPLLFLFPLLHDSIMFGLSHQCRGG